jgi:primosomal protein N' (replication factor Y) (superfamily II helicase)
MFVIKFPMHYCDILFPINLGPLTYKCPEELEEKAEPGIIVSAPLKSKLTKGVIVRKLSSPPNKPAREFSEIHGDSPVLSKNMMRLLQWMSDYYVASEGVVLKQTVPKELFLRIGPQKPKKEPHEGPHIEFIDIRQEDILPLRKSFSDNVYRTFLVHAPSLKYEYSLVPTLISPDVKNVLVIVPEVSQADLIYSGMKRTFGDRACILHGGISTGRRSEYLKGIVSGKHDVVLGTGTALFAPLKSVSLIMVLHEHSNSYKREEGVRYNIRDVAVMRGFLENSTVVLSSITPSVDSYFNAFSMRYTLIKPISPKRPTVKIVDMRHVKKASPNISKTTYEISKNRLREGKKIMFVINRRGYSTLLLCKECGNTENCRGCHIPFVMHKNDNLLKCHYCGAVQNLPERCGRCGSFNLELLGYGTQRIQEEIEGLFGMETMRFDSDTAKKRSEKDEFMKNFSTGSTQVIIGTKMMTKRFGSTEKFSMAAVLNVDASLNFPDFRAAEKTYRELSSIMELVTPEGDVLIQTRFPQNSLFQYLKKDDYVTFIKDELSMRKAVLYPPYSKLLNIRFAGGSDLADTIIKIIRNLNLGIEILGPAVSKNKKGVKEFSILLKSGDRKMLKTAAKAVLKRYAARKGSNIIIDIDPV